MATLRALAHDAVAARHRLATMNGAVAGFWKVVAESPALRARTRELSEELSEELERELARMLASSVAAPIDDPTARLLAAMLVGAWRVAFREALHRQRTARSASARNALLELLDRGFLAVSAAARGTPYG